ncbi:hypothetical protein BGW39_005441 [Mortierella sp. 14UC]|nr:hypothetical protein BGW39_005441 [Mortierella sp. 14UC]
MSKRQIEDDTERRVQAFRPLYNHIDSNNGLPSTATSTASRSDTTILHIDVHLDPNDKEIVLWEDIKVAFRSAVNVRHNIRILPFLKDELFNTIQPLRIAAIPNATLDVYIEGNITQEERDAARTRSAAPQTIHPPKRGPQYDPQEQALWKLKSLGDLMISLPTSAGESINIDGKGESNGSSPANNPHATPTPHDVIMQLADKAKEGDTSAQFKLGEAYLRGYENVLPQDSEAAMDWFLQAANRGHPAAQYHVGLLHNGFPGVPKDEDVATAWFLKAANQQHVTSQLILGEKYLLGDGVPKDTFRALQWLLPPANDGDAGAQCYIGSMLQEGTSPLLKDYSKAMEWYLKAAAQGHEGSQVKIGLLYYKGLGVHKDHPIALEWFFKAAMQGCKNGQYLVGLCYQNGQGLRDFPKAMEWYLKAARQGMSGAQFAIGRIYEQGDKGFDKDYPVAMEWYLKAAEQGDVDAQVSLAEMYDAGKGLKEAKPAEAAEWYKKAVKQDSDEARYNLAMMYSSGRGVFQSYSRAKELLLYLVEHTPRGLEASDALERVIRKEAQEEEFNNFY